MKSMEEMLAAAQKAAENIQNQMGEAQAKLDTIEVEGSAGGGLVKVRATARGRILGVSIDESLMKPEERQMVEDLVTAAFNDARDKAECSPAWACRRGSSCRVCKSGARAVGRRAQRTCCPPLTTALTCSSSRTSFNGSPSTATISA